MNPVTAMLLEQIDLPGLPDWIDAWDQLEELLLRVYRAGCSSRLEQRQYRALCKALRAGYGPWRDGLHDYWRATYVQGVPLDRDPFLALTELKPLEAGHVDWGMIQKLPAAREALNAFLLDRIRSEEGASNDSG